MAKAEKTASLRSGVQMLEYSNVRKRRREGSLGPRKSRKQELKALRRGKRETTMQKKEVASCAFSLKPRRGNWNPLTQRDF